MLYTEYINKAAELTIEQADNGLYFLEPLWRNILYDNQMDYNIISDAITDWGAILDVLKLEIEKRNTINSLQPYINNWIHDVITATVEPAILQEETDYIKNLTEYLKAAKEPRLKDEEWNKFKST